VSFLVGDVVLTKKSKQRGHIQKTSDDYIPSFIDLNKFSSRNVFFFPLRYYRPGQIDFWLFKISFASAKNPSSEKSYVSGAIGVRFVRSFFSPLFVTLSGGPLNVRRFSLFLSPSRPNPVLGANTANHPT
jgi:hypothetical protein